MKPWGMYNFFPIIGKLFSNRWKTGLFPMSYQIGQNPGA